nr:hypothetical protein [Tanacetum cinerariifolium]
MDEGGSALKMPNLKQFNTFRRQMTIEEAKSQLEEMKTLADLKAKKEKSEKKLKKVMTLPKILAQAQRAKKLPIMKISYKIHKVSKDATIRTKRNNQPPSLTVYENFVWKKLGFSEWIEVHTLASKNKGKSNDILLKNLKAKFEWIKSQAGKLGIPLPPELSAFGLSAAKRREKEA